jgi:hypothetical protein
MTSAVPAVAVVRSPVQKRGENHLVERCTPGGTMPVSCALPYTDSTAVGSAASSVGSVPEQPSAAPSACCWVANRLRDPWAWRA